MCRHTHIHSQRHTYWHPQIIGKHVHIKKNGTKGRQQTYGMTLGSAGCSERPIVKSPLFPLWKSSNAVVAVHVSANVPQDHIEDEEYGEDEERH